MLHYHGIGVTQNVLSPCDFNSFLGEALPSIVHCTLDRTPRGLGENVVALSSPP